MSGVVAGGIATGYRYNGLGQRVAKSGAAGVAVHYVYDEAGRLLGEYDASGKAIQETVYLDNLPLAVLKPGSAGTAPLTASIHYVYADHLWTPRVLTRASDNKMVWRWDNADPFGLDQPDQNPSRVGNLIYNPRLPGQVFDKESNNHYNYLRDYDPQLGRYIQSDPIGLAGGINTFAYVNGNPLNTMDPTGEIALAGAIIGAGTDLAVQTLIEGKSLKCVSWGQVGMAGALGAVGGGFLGGAFKHAKSGKKWFDLSQKWKNVSPRVRNAQETPAGQDLHHWLIERNSVVGRNIPESIKNHPFNLSPVDEAFHTQLHRMNPVSRTILGAPNWAQAAGAAGMAGSVSSAAVGDQCGCD